MTNNEIKKIIERDINEYGVLEAFKKIVSSTISKNVHEFKKMPISFEKILYLANISISLSIRNFKEVGLISKLYDVVIYNKHENVVQDEIMNFAINEALRLLTE